ncbi:MAG: DUF2294 family protein [Firmicutes bacterium]|nr:DUF2294 family protein [Bacillota bacterium]
MEDKAYLAQLKVLYVEDDPEARRELNAFLKRRVGKLLTAADGKQGLEIFSQQQPDLVIADLLMPQMNGMAMLKKMRKEDPDCRFIIISSVGETEVVLNAVDLGIAKYVVKPVNLPALDQALLKLAKDLRRERKEPLIGEGDEKRRYEAAIKKEMALFLKQRAGKGPRDVAVFIHDSSIDIIAYGTLTPLEQRALASPAGCSIAQQLRLCFYKASTKELNQKLEAIVGRTVKLDQILSEPAKENDKLVFTML